jgi:hypothetical protein
MKSGIKRVVASSGVQIVVAPGGITGNIHITVHFLVMAGGALDGLVFAVFKRHFFLKLSLGRSISFRGGHANGFFRGDCILGVQRGQCQKTDQD